MAEIWDARQVLERERRAVLADLRKNQAATEKLAERRAELRTEAIDLLARGKLAGVPMTEMAEALSLSRQQVHRLIAEEERRG